MISEHRIINVVDRYLSVELAREMNRDAGYRAEHQIGLLIEYQGQLPVSGGGGNSNGAMIYQVGMMFKEPKDPVTVWACRLVACLLKNNFKHYRALVAWVMFKNRPDPKTGKDFHTDERIAAVLDVSRSTFLKNLEAAKVYVSDLVELSELGIPATS